MSDIDVTTAKEIFAQLHEPLLAAEERIVRQSSPTLDAGAVLDLALRAAIVRLDFTINTETFEHLRWKVIIHRSKAQATIEDLHAARVDRALARARSSRAFRDEAGTVWTVTEGSWRAVTGAEQACLLFSSDAAVRRVKNVPENWNSLTDTELSALSWSR